MKNDWITFILVIELQIQIAFKGTIPQSNEALNDSKASVEYSF